jgi:hypothetical protein
MQREMPSPRNESPGTSGSSAHTAEAIPQAVFEDRKGDAVMLKSWLLPLALAACGFVTGCASTPTKLTPEGSNVKCQKADPVSSCEEIGAVVGLGMAWDENKAETAKNAMRNAAAEKGGNYVRLETVERLGSGNVEYTGTAFKCPKHP